MARKPRKYGETGIYHVILRGNNQELIFYDEKDRIFFMEKLKKYITELNIDIYSYCLMDNHVHLLIGKANKSMPLLIKKLTCSYVYYFNHKYNRTGHLFQGRYKSEPVETINYFKTAYRYILQNPEKAGICNFQIYKWNSIHSSSFNTQLIKTNFIYSIFSSEQEMKSFLMDKNDDLCMEYYTQTFSDDEIKAELIKKLFKINNPIQLQKNQIDVLRSKLKYLKQLGLSINQIARITGINKSIIKSS